MKIDLALEYVMGYLSCGHIEGEVDFAEEEEKDFKTLLKKEKLTNEEENRLNIYKKRIMKSTKIIIDDYSLEDYGEPYWGDLV